jgi:iron complex outermembrane receptor protein
VRTAIRFFLSSLVLTLAVPLQAASQTAPIDLGLASLEELMNIRVTSVARKSQRAEDVAAAIYVITGDDILRSGLRTLPEILRLAPGVQVAQVGASGWAVSIRGFNQEYSNKLLVLVDGRSVYTRVFSGVIWHLQDMPVTDIDRIEVIRGPGGSVWGANAVNGVINIITRPASQTPGLAVDLGAGTLDRGHVGVRYGGTIGRASYRAYSQWSTYSGLTDVDPTWSTDPWRSVTGGARIDWSRGQDAFVVNGHVTTNRTRPALVELTSFDPAVPPSTDGRATGDDLGLLGRWTRTSSTGTVLQVQAFHSRMRRNETNFRTSDQTTDIDAQYETRLAGRHGIVFGGGHRVVDVDTAKTFTMQLGSARLQTTNLFVQDEIALHRDLALTVGSRLEHDTFGAWGLMPSARALWNVSAGQRLWVAVSRTRRTPSVAERDLRINLSVSPGPVLPVVLAIIGNPSHRSERLLQIESGYRFRIGTNAALDATVFTGSYDRLTNQEPLIPIVEATPPPQHVVAGIQLANLLNARATGVEVNTQWHPTPQWQLDASYSHLRITSDLDSTSTDPISPNDNGDAPRHQWQVRSTVSLHPGLQLGGSLWHVGQLPQLAVPAYTRLDLRGEIRITTALTLAVMGQNLLDRSHIEFAQPFFHTPSVPRSARVELRWVY